MNGRKYAEEQEVVSTAVIGALHSLMDIAQDRELDPDTRIHAATHVLSFAFAVDVPEEDPEESENEDSSEPSEGETK